MSENDWKGINICKNCTHYRMKPPVKPFKNLRGQNPDILKLMVEWEKKQNQIAQTEHARYTTGMKFTYEPVTFAWCYEWTKLDESVRIDATRGLLSKNYIICARANKRGDCKYFVRCCPECKTIIDSNANFCYKCGINQEKILKKEIK